MDLAQIDSLIERLEKRKTLRPGSPPVSINGHLGVWRTIRHNRVFIELDGQGNLGRILIGPPSFVGRTFDQIPDDVWESITPRSTLKEFRNVRVASNGLDTLKQSIKNSVGPEDTRREAVDGMGTVEQLVPIARSAGFSDDEIKQALSGQSPNQPLGDVASRRAATSEEPITGNEAQRVKASTLQETNAFVADSLARIPEAIRGASGDDRNKALADFLEKVIAKKLKEQGDDIFSRKVLDLANALRAGKYTQAEIEERIREVAQNRAALKTKMLNDKERAILEDSVKVKELVDTFDKKIEEKVNQKIEESAGKFKPRQEGVSEDRVRELVEETRAQSEETKREAEKQRREAARMREEAASDRQRAQEFMSEAQKARYEVEAALSLLNELASQVNSQKAKEEVKKVVEIIRTGTYSRRSILLRLLQLLQLLLLLVPGL